ncbi:MAG: DUF5131 family protein [Clostridia bacterium]|nr:DUF5131 family protein [Clostridia bacterium]
MAMWNPWRGCKKCSDGCLHCYIHKGDLKRNVNTNEIVKTKDLVEKIKDNIEIKDETQVDVLASNPATGDNLIKDIIAFIASIVGIVICKKTKKKMKNTLNKTKHC